MNTCDEDIEADDKIIAEEGERELYEHFRFVADKGQNLLRVDKFLVARLESSSRNRVQQAARSWLYSRKRESGQVELSRKAARCRVCRHGSTQIRIRDHTPKHTARCRIRRQNRLGCQQTGRIGRTPRTREL